MLAPPQAAPDNLRGAALLIFASAIFTIEVTLVRLAGPGTNQAQIMFCRAFAQLVMVGGWIAWTGTWGQLRTRRAGLHAWRGTISIVTWWLYYSSFLKLDLALATTLTFATQLFVVAFAAPVLGERVGPARIGATVLGFLGVLLATRIGTVAFELNVVYGVCAAIGGAAIILMSSALTRTESTLTIMFYIGLATTLGALPPLVLTWTPPDPAALGLVVLAGALGAFGMGVMIEAYRVGEVSALAPIPYLRLVFAIVAGLLVFGEAPHWTTLAGAVVIIATALAVSHPRLRQG